MKKFFVKYWNNFANTYNLRYTMDKEQEEQAIEQGYERISRKEAIHLCALENQRRKEYYNFSGYADSVIIPWGYDYDDGWMNDKTMRKNGYIIEQRA